MLSSPFSPWRSVLTPQAALDLATVHLENARKAKNSELALTFCKDAETSLARIKSSARKTYVSSSRSEDRALCNEIGTTYSELGVLLHGLGYPTKAQACYKNEEKWGYVSDINILYRTHKALISNRTTILQNQYSTEDVFSCKVNHPLSPTTSHRLLLQTSLKIKLWTLPRIHLLFT